MVARAGITVITVNRSKNADSILAEVVGAKVTVITDNGKVPAIAERAGVEGAGIAIIAINRNKYAIAIDAGVISARIIVSAINRSVNAFISLGNEITHAFVFGAEVVIIANYRRENTASLSITGINRAGILIKAKYRDMLANSIPVKILTLINRARIAIIAIHIGIDAISGFIA